MAGEAALLTTNGAKGAKWFDDRYREAAAETNRLQFSAHRVRHHGLNFNAMAPLRDYHQYRAVDSPPAIIGGMTIVRYLKDAED